MANQSRGNAARVDRLWKRLGQWYGSRFADVYGPEPSEDWRACVDEASNDDVVAVLAMIRQRHVTFPPTLPEFESLFREVRGRKKFPRASEASMHDRLGDFVLKHRSLTFNQLRGWEFKYRIGDDGFPVTTALVIPADGDKPGYRITVEDMLGEETEMTGARP
jgi:hypothetical protein